MERLQPSGMFPDCIGIERATCIAMDTKKCAHPSCRCIAKEGSDYCGTYCEGEAKTADILCNCGHPQCAEKV